jgi:arylsulfatase A-like enzyme
VKNLCVFMSLLLCISSSFSQGKPNIVMIILDDLNDFVGVMGGHPQVKTPNIDRLAGQGILFSNAPVCSPSRASFMTGVAPYSSKNYGFKSWLKSTI